ncbi:polysaccharide pyruvyl transferase family protein [Actinotalea sp. AC32]|nr:polysaccharide pyruvyl transferase family protein [Actinotalea sp. AC32]
MGESPVQKEAVVVSFCAGKEYYFRAADRLEEQLDELGVDHDIQRLETPEGSDWIDICRQKIRFFRDMLVKHERPVAWMDVDTEILRRPDALLDSTADLTAFLRSFKYLVGFDPEQHSRLLAPSYLTFNYNDRVLSFLDFAVRLVDESDVRATDDYFLQEALTSWDGDLRLMLLKPTDISRHKEDARSETAYFIHGDSGNVGTFKGEAEQHQIAALAIPRQVRVLQESARESLRKGDREAAGFFYNRIRRLTPNDPNALKTYLEFLHKTKQWKKFDYHVAQSRKNPRFLDAVERADYLAAIERENWTRADVLFERAGKRDSPSYPLMKSRQVRTDLDRRAAAAGIADEDRVKMWWMETPYPGNFGDIINPYVVEGLTGIPPKFTHNPNRLLAIGSIIKFAKKGTSVWGAGCPSRDQVLSPEATYHAVRGPLTREVVLANGGSADEVYGDAAWFLPKIYNPDVPKTHRLGVIFHLTHQTAAPPLDPDVKVIDIARVGAGEIEAFIRELLSCEAVLSTSLHGVIVAHAYGIPVRWCVASGSARQIHGDGMKFEDYFNSVGRSAPEPLDVSALERVTSTLAAECVDNPETPIDLVRLAEAAPFDVRIPL